jgi:phthiocerol/phenolphthiocerol synthesis type-I polyketide synthase D
LGTEATQVAVMPVDWATLARSYPAFASDPFLEGLVGQAGDTNRTRANDPLADAALAAWRSASGQARPARMAEYLAKQAAKTLGMSSEALDPAAPLSSFGFDSLMAVQLKNQIEADLGVVVPMMRFLDGPSVNQLAEVVLRACDGSPNEAPTNASSEGWEEGSL